MSIRTDRHSALHLIVFLVMVSLAGPVFAQALARDDAPQAPTALLERTSVRMLSALAEQRTNIRQDPASIYAIVEEVLVPHVDLERASRWALGQHWREASPEQRARFQHEFHTLLVRFYATALVQYLDGHVIPRDVITFLPTRSTVRGREAVVRTLVRQEDGRPVAVNYQLRQTADGWKVCDVHIDGVSIIGAYRSVFNAEVRRHGMDGLISAMVHYNHRLGVGH